MAAVITNTARHSWLTSEFLESILKSSENDQNVKVNDFVLHEAVPKGENYTSHLIRVTINYTDGQGSQQKSFVIKTVLDSDEMNEKMKKCGLFDKEIAFYRDILPKFKKYTDMIDKDFVCAPRCYAASENPTYLVFEDLTSHNFRNIDRRLGLDFNACSLLFRKLAKLHAITTLIYAESPELFEVHKVRLLSHENTEMLAAMTNGIEDIKELCLGWPGYEHFHDKFDVLINDILNIWESTYAIGVNTFNTLTHGDLWSNNIMYQFDETNNTPIDVRMVDFQIGYYGPPAIDLCYLFYTSTANDMFEQDWDRLIQIYHTELVIALKLAKYPNARIPSLTELQIQMLKKPLAAAIISLSAVALRHMSSDLEPDMNTVLLNESRHHRLALYGIPMVYERVQYLLDFFHRKGFLEGCT